MFKYYVQKKLERYVKKYFRRHPEVKLVVVTGSVGKTGTKAAIAEVLAQQYRVRMSLRNLNTEIGAPMSILGIDMPDSLRSMGAWRRVFRIARQRLRAQTDVDIVVQELGADKPGDIAAFMKYLKPDIAVVAAVTPEHMEFFKNIEAVAEEEITAANAAKVAVINREDVDGEHFAQYLSNPNIYTYGDTDAAEYSFEVQDFDVAGGYKGAFLTPNGRIPVEGIHVVGQHNLRPISAAVAVGALLEVPVDKMVAGVTKVRPVPGRMDILRGLEGATIIDDSYNSSPAAATAALATLYSIQAPARIAVLGDMAELGDISAEEHKKLGELCDPALLSWVVTVGPQSKQYLAPVAKAKGCQVASFDNALQAGAFVHKVLEPGAFVLFKGSQSGVYLEEAVKVILHSTEEVNDLVRQTPEWVHIKTEFFDSFESEVDAGDDKY
ncbi:MAG: UDP-N-acetylmuramoyl-tripeptide--D-alanyl-D-alanine ligase [Candidatus Nomurabacteria bacterium]|jgi:UDP-N-acetylmuramoyl-tripeptide--D-alanyl-D-alanine ligase|nr:UDP-N-acetylmuramoyl-tripeptide--D-alanyl-D-alanine ligase [Candidatus Nomurabacteria bacterium]